MDPAGVGALQLAFEQLKAKLAEEGLFDPARKKSLPVLPQRLGIVTSPSGAAIRDILSILNRRYPNIQVTIYPALVQGDEAPPQVRRGIEILDAMGAFDVIIVTRGGGSMEDLWAFNDEGVARAIAECSTPVISAVGHEVDFTIADFVADVRAPTPSAAAELVVGRKENIREALTAMERRMALAMGNRIEHIRAILAASAPARMLSTVRRTFETGSQRVDRLSQGLRFHMKEAASAGGGRLETLAAQLQSLSPLRALARGYSITTLSGDDKPLVSIIDIQRGDSVDVRLKDGSFRGSVDEIQGAESSEQE
jgi:exodeoxyribonuclease VII large subunit